MLNRIALTVAIGAVLALFAVEANAMPLSPTHQATFGNNLIQVRFDCAPGWHFNPRRGGCVPNGADVRGDCAPGWHFNGARCVPNRPDCGLGWHFSPNRGRCVPNGGPRRFDCAPGWHFSPGRGGCVPNGPQRRFDCWPGWHFDPQTWRLRAERHVVAVAGPA